MGASGGGGGGAGAGAGASRTARALRFLLLLVMALAAVEYLFGSILDASPLRTYLYTPLANSTLPTQKTRELPELWQRKSPEPLQTNNANHAINSTQYSNLNDTTIYSFNTTLNSTEIKNNISFNSTNKIETFRDLFNEVEKSQQSKDTQKPQNADPAGTKTPEKSTPKPKESMPSSTHRLISKLMDKLSVLTSTEPSILRSNDSLPYCEPTNLGPININKTKVSIEEVDRKYPEVETGGMYTPPNCTAKHRVAIIVPYRNREEHLGIFLNHMHPFLMKQQLEYGIFIIEQAGVSDFNRAKLFNVGFVESLKQKSWQCFVFHDVDLLPMDERNLYSCPRQPRHMSAAIDKFHFHLLYDSLFGGVSAMTYKQFVKVNGFSNKYWGWGAEDDDMAYRLKLGGYHIARYKMSIARYAMLTHKSQTPNPKRWKLLSQTSKTFLKDGLTTLEYIVNETVKHHLFTLITVNIEGSS